MKLPPEWREFIVLLSSHHARFLVVGAHALAALGRPRATQDIDLFVEPTPTNARRVCAALADFGFTTLSRQADAFAKPDRMATLGRPPLRIDVMTSISGVSFRDAWRGRLRVRLDGIQIGFLGRREFIRNKAASGRPKDLLDIALLGEVSRVSRAKTTAGRPSSRPSKRSRRGTRT
jgi:hypothetical protein